MQVVLRSFQPSDLAPLRALGHRADQLFADHGHASLAAAPPPSLTQFSAFLASGDCVVAASGDGPLGFALVTTLGDLAWLREIAVDPVVGRRGIGSRLLEGAVAIARSRGHAAIALTTFRDVPFNMPFYAARGFVVLEPATAPPTLRAQFMAEVPPGTDPSHRVLMMRGTA